MKCKLCGSKRIKKISIEENYYFCTNCELIFIEKGAEPSEKQEFEIYKTHENTHENEGYINMFKEFIKKLFIEHLDEINEVLEYGCGPGPVLADILENKGLNVTKYDPFFYPDLKFQDQQYDLITSTEVFEHFQDPKEEITKLIKLMKPNAYLAVMTSFHNQIDHFKDWWYRRDSTHITFYNLNTFKYIENNYPLQIIKTDCEKSILMKKT
ncbi:MAG TPA: class I SAM-dependent methyltransferase [Halanaerobiales bacterium]|nr:class I SAM-dependent methyltransferase [Halanaerobiales bacterium]